MVWPVLVVWWCHWWRRRGVALVICCRCWWCGRCWFSAVGGVVLPVAGGGVVAWLLLPVICCRLHCITGTARGARPAMDAGRGDLLPVSGRVVRRLVSCAYISTISTAAGGGLLPVVWCCRWPVIGGRWRGEKTFFKLFPPTGELCRRKKILRKGVDNGTPPCYAMATVNGTPPC